MIKLVICRSFVALVWENWTQFQRLLQYCRTGRTEGQNQRFLAEALETEELLVGRLGLEPRTT